MEPDPYFIQFDPSLLDLREAEASRFSFLPLIWEAAESLISPDPEVRQAGLERLVEYQSGAANPLVAYLLITRLEEPHLPLRLRIVELLARMVEGKMDDLAQTSPPSFSPPSAAHVLMEHLAKLQSQHVLALLQTAEFDPLAIPWVESLLSACSFAGVHLAEILADRQTPLVVRRLAAEIIGRIGFLDALPTLERLANRLEARKNNNGFLYPEQDETSLLEVINPAIEALKAP